MKICYKTMIEKEKCIGANGIFCTVYTNEGIEYRNRKNHCEFYEIRNEKIEAGKKKINPIKKSKRS